MEMGGKGASRMWRTQTPPLPTPSFLSPLAPPRPTLFAGRVGLFAGFFFFGVTLAALCSTSRQQAATTVHAQATHAHTLPPASAGAFSFPCFVFAFFFSCFTRFSPPPSTYSSLTDTINGKDGGNKLGWVLGKRLTRPRVYFLLRASSQAGGCIHPRAG